MKESEKWTYWNGSKDNTPPNLPDDRAVTVKLRDNSTACTVVPSSYNWEHRGGAGDIVAYRIEPPAGDNLIDTTFGAVAVGSMTGLNSGGVIRVGESPALAASVAAGECFSGENFISRLGSGVISVSPGIPVGSIEVSSGHGFTLAGSNLQAVTGGIGDINSDARGAGARYNTGKPQLELLPLRLMARYYELLGVAGLEKKRALNALFRLATFQERGDPRALMLAMIDLGPGVLHDTARVFEYGRKKYAAWNWSKGMAWSVPLACAARHLEAILLGEALDPESKLPHRGHGGCNIVMLETYSHEQTYLEGDDRPKAGLLRALAE